MWGLPCMIGTKKLLCRRSIEGLTVPGQMGHIVDTLFLTHQTTVWAEIEVPYTGRFTPETSLLAMVSDRTNCIKIEEFVQEFQRTREADERNRQ